MALSSCVLCHSHTTAAASAGIITSFQWENGIWEKAKGSSAYTTLIRTILQGCPICKRDCETEDLKLSTSLPPTQLGICKQRMAYRRLRGKESACQAEDADLVPGSGRSPGEGNGNLFQDSCLETPWTEKPRGLQSMGSQRIRYNLGTKQQQAKIKERINRE